LTLDRAVASSLQGRVSGFNLNLSHNGMAPWDDRLIAMAKRTAAGALRYPGGANNNAHNWRTGHQDLEWALRFEPDFSCTPQDSSACSSGETCAPQPTPAEPDAYQCQRVCSQDGDCSSEEICLFEQCTLSCADSSGTSGDDALCNPSGGSTYECYSVDETTFGCLGGKVFSYLSYQETLLGKGYYTPGDMLRLTEVIGARSVMQVNAFTDTASSAHDLAEAILRRGERVDLWQLSSEPHNFRSANSPPTFWRAGADYAEDMLPYTAAIEQAYANAGEVTPPIALAFSDAETEWQRGWDWGTDEVAEGASGDGRPGVGDHVFDNGRSFTAADFHWYPGGASSTVEEGAALAAEDLAELAPSIVDDYFLPLICADEGGVCSDPDEPEIAISEYNIQTTWRTAISAIHAAEFVLRSVEHPRLRMLGFHSLTEGCLELGDLHRQTAKMAGYYNVFGSFDSNAKNADGSDSVNFEHFTGLACLALELVQPVVNAAQSSHSVEIAVGEAAEAPDALYARAFSTEASEVILLTNRSDEAYEFALQPSESQAFNAGVVESFGGQAMNVRNCGSTDPALVPSDEVCSEGGDIALSSPIPWEPGQTLQLPPWGVLRLTMGREAASIAAPESIEVVTGVRSATVTWSPVEGAESTVLHYGVQDGVRMMRQSVSADACTTTCTVLLEGLAHSIPHTLTLASVNDAGHGPSSEVLLFTPDREELATGLWGPALGSASWSVENGLVSTDGASGANYLPMVQDETSNAYLDLHDLSVQADFRLSCSCDPNSTDACDRVGLVGRFADGSNLVQAYLEPGDPGCYFRILRKSVDEQGQVVGEVISRSPYLGVPIADSAGVIKTHSDGVTPLYADIPAVNDGQWHQMRLTAEGQVIRLWLDGRMITAAIDDRSESGSVALYGRNQEIEWRDVSISRSSW